MIVLVYLAVAVGVAFGLYRYFPDATRRWFYRIQAARKTLFALLFVSTMLVFLMSGVLMLQLLGGAMAVLAVLQVLFEDPFGVNEVLP